MPHRRSRLGLLKRELRSKTYSLNKDAWWETVNKHQFYDVLEEETLNLKGFCLQDYRVSSEKKEEVFFEGEVLNDRRGLGYLQLRCYDRDHESVG